MIEQIILVLVIGIYINIFLLAWRLNQIFKHFDNGELHRTLAGLQQRMTKARKRENTK